MNWRALLSQEISQRERAAGFAGNLQRLHAGDAQIVVQYADRIVADDILRPRDGESGDRNAARQRLELHDTERVRSAWKYEDVGRRQMRGQGPILQQPEELTPGNRRLSSASCGPVPMMTFVPGRSSERNASRFFSTAIRPTVMKIGRGRSSAMARSGLNRLVSTPRVHMPRLRNPRRSSSLMSDGVDTIVTAAAA